MSNIINIKMRDPNWSFAKHFVHCMQYMYYIASVVLNDPDKKYIIQEPNIPNWKSPYVNSFLEKLLSEYPNIKFSKNINDENALIFNHKNFYSADFVYNDTEYLQHMYANWFPYDNSNKLRSFFVKNPNLKTSEIGIINRHTRKMLNVDELYFQLKKEFKTQINLTSFENKSFDYQINFFNENRVIISPHGAELCSIPFMRENSLVVECAHNEWHPYDYFPGLSCTTHKCHAMLVDDHSCFPKNCSKEYEGKSGKYKGRSMNQKLNITVDVNKIIHVIKKYLSGKLNSNICNLF
jgi:hypothetical protein